MGEILRVAGCGISQTVNKNATDGHHASDTVVQEANIVVCFLRTVRAHLDGEQILVPSQQPANKLSLAQHTLVTIATEKIVSIKSFKDNLLEKSN